MEQKENPWTGVKSLGETNTPPSWLAQFAQVRLRWETEKRKFGSVQSLSCVLLFATPWTAARQASLSISNSQSLLKLMSIEMVMPSNHLILYCPLLLLTSVFLNIRIFNNESVLCFGLLCFY